MGLSATPDEIRKASPELATELEEALAVLRLAARQLAHRGGSSQPSTNARSATPERGHR